MFARRTPGIRVRTGTDGQRTQPRPRTDDVRACEVRIGEVVIRRVEQVRHVALVGTHVLGRNIIERIGRAHDGESASGQHEHHAPVLWRDERERGDIAHPRTWHAHVHAFAPTHAGDRSRARQRLDAIAPRSRRIHHHPCSYFHGHSAFGIDHVRADNAITLAHEGMDPGVIYHHGAGSLRREDVRQREARIVRCRIPVPGTAPQLVRAQSRLSRQNATCIEPLVARDVPEKRQRIIEGQRHRQRPSCNTRPAIDRPRERQRMNEMRRDPQQCLPLAARLEHQVKLPMLEVANAAMHES